LARVADISDEGLEMSADGLEIQIETSQEYISLGPEGIVETRSAHSHGVEQFRQVRALEAPLPECHKGILQGLIRIEALRPHVSF
jgi:hypothetical protein